MRLRIAYSIILICSIVAPALTSPAAPVQSRKWYTEANLPPGTLDSLSPKQKKIALQVLNSALCNCGCAKGSILQCRASDSECSVSKRMLAETIRLAKAGQAADQIAKAMEVLKKPSQISPQPSVVKMVPIREDDSYLGPRFAKVTIVEFADFQ